MSVPLNQIILGNCLEELRKLPSNSVHCVVTSPPYYGLRDYKLPGTPWPACSYRIFGCEVKVEAWTGCYGLEPTVEMFVAHTVLIFEEVRRVLRNDGTLWLNFGDSYAAQGKNRTEKQSTAKSTLQGGKKTQMESCQQISKLAVRESGRRDRAQVDAARGGRINSPSIKPKDLLGIPWHIAFALREAGWYLRQDIIWHKPNPMPESVTDRCTKAHEYVFLLSKSKKYFYDAEAIKVPWVENEYDIKRSLEGQPKYNGKHKDGYYNAGGTFERTNLRLTGGVVGNAMNGANRRSVWTITTKGYPDAHFATFPTELPELCIKAGTSAHGCCAQCGAPWERIFNKKLVPTRKAPKTFVVDERDLNADAQDQGSNRQKDGHKSGHINQTTTTGWKPTCKCRLDTGEPYPLTPAIVLDTFSGSGTTFVTAQKLGRHAIAFELNPAYIKLSDKRRTRELGMFNPILPEVVSTIPKKQRRPDRPAAETTTLILTALVNAPFRQKSGKALCAELDIHPSVCSRILAPLEEAGTITSEKVGQITIFKLNIEKL